MAVAHSAASESHTGTTGSTSQASFSWTHTQTGTPQGVLVFVHTNANADYISSVTYGGTGLTRVSGGQAIDTATEPCRTDLFFLGSGLASGNQTIVVNRTNNATVMYASAATVTAATNTAVTGIVLLQNNGTLAEQSVDDGSPGTDSLRYAAVFSGLGTAPAAGASSTGLTSINFTANSCAMVRETTAGQGARSVGFSAATDDRAAVHVAVYELRALSTTGDKGTFTVTGIAAGTNKGLKVTADQGSAYVSRTWAKGVWDSLTWGDVGDTATLSRTRSLQASTGSVSVTGIAAGTNRGLVVGGDLGKVFIAERNMRLWSESFDNAAWSKTNASISANSTTAPDGTLTADALIENSTSGVGHAITRTVTLVSGKTYTASCYFKAYAGPIDRWVRLQLGNSATFGTDTYINVNATAGTITATNGSPSNTSITSVGNGWHRASVTRQYTGAGVTTAPAIQLVSTGGTGLYADADGLSGIYLWGAQYEEGSLSDYDATGPAVAANPELYWGRRLVADTGARTVTGNAATLTKTTLASIAADPGSFAVTGISAGTYRGLRTTGSVGSFAVTGVAAGVYPGRLTTGAAGSFVISGVAATLKPARLLTAASGTSSITGVAATTKAGRLATGAAGAFSVVGVAATLKPARLLTASTGVRAVAGVAAGLLTARRLTSSTGDFTISGVAATTKASRYLLSAAGSYSVTGVSATTKAGRYLSAAVGAFTVTGVSAGLAPARRLTCATGASAITGNAATLTKASASTLPATTGTVVVTGIAAVTARSRIMGGAAGAFSIAGVAAALKPGRQLTASAGSCAVTGTDAGLVKTGARSLTADTVAVAVSGNSATLRRAITLSSGAGAVEIGLGLAGLSRTRTVYAGPGTFTATGNDAALSRVSAFLAEPGAFAVTGISASLERGLLVAASPGAYAVTGYSTATSSRRRHVLIF